MDRAHAVVTGLSDRIERVEDRINGVLPAPLKVGVGVLYWYSTRTSARFDTFADRPGVRRWCDLAIVTLLVLQVGSLLLVSVAAVNALNQPPTAASVAALGPLTNACFWLVLLNANVGLLNALPILPMDGGRVLSEGIDTVADRAGYGISPRLRNGAVYTLSVAVAALVVVAVVGPYL